MKWVSVFYSVIFLAVGCQHQDKSESIETNKKSFSLDAPVFIENTTCPANPCDDVARVCGTEIASFEIDTLLAFTGAGTLVNCLKELGINLPFDGVEIIGIDTWGDLTAFLGEKICDAASCLPPAGPAAAVIGACMCYTRVKGMLNCSIAQSECESAKNETPPEDPIRGACANSSVMACVSDGAGGQRAALDEEISIQCRNMARRYRYREPSPKFDECVSNCVALTRSTRSNGCLQTTVPDNEL